MPSISGRKRCRPARSVTDYRREFEARFGEGGAERFIQRCEETFRGVAAAFGIDSPKTAWQWYCHLTGEIGEPRDPVVQAVAARKRGRKPGEFLRPDVTIERIRELIAGGFSKARAARVLQVSRQTLYQRIGSQTG